LLSERNAGKQLPESSLLHDFPKSQIKYKFHIFTLMAMTQVENHWSVTEKTAAEAALKKAYDREIEALLEYVRETSSKILQSEDVWQLHDFLSARRHDIDGKYDNRESFLVFTLSKLVKDGLLELSELEGLSADKRAKVSILTRM
jgi:hypothetical protein